MDPETGKRIKVLLVVLLIGGAIVGYLRLRSDREEAAEQMVAERRKAEEDVVAVLKAAKDRQADTHLARGERVRVEVVQVPARFQAPLPATAEDFRRWDDRFPPRSLVEAKLCAGDEDMWTRFLAMAHALARPQIGSSADPPSAEALGRLVSYCSRQEICPRARSALSASEHPGLRRALHHALAYCTAPEDRAVFAAACAQAGEEADSACPRAGGREASPVSPDRPDPARDTGADDLGRKLQKVGLLPAGPLPEGVSGAVSVRQALEAAGRVHSFDTETGQFPNEHDGLLAALAALAGPPLSAAAFEEVPPPDPEGGGRPYVLRGYLGGKRYTVSAEDLGDWYDVDAVLVLLEAMLRDQGSSVRLVPLPTGDQTASILAAEGAALERARAEGLIQLGEADEGRSRGKAFEDEVLRKIQSGELRLEGGSE
ncbi:MAG TPA: hypothetical protein PK668_26585 [Myxococcota bacterium]|nr:hypothetical protein [Myxococcota bacterium]HRY97096.1 hypothetical protein [Myxococcota bacterium]HSA22239.1 hypothetical protein [Myxococcota bacterium]